MAKHYDIVMVGGGHAGVEAAWAASKLGASVALITMQREAIARMSCNPAIGGLGKGQIVREIDALGGIMALGADQAGIRSSRQVDRPRDTVGAVQRSLRLGRAVSLVAVREADMDGW